MPIPSPASAPAPASGSPVGTAEVGRVGVAHFHELLSARLLLFDFLNTSYVGGVDYKNGFDAFGQPLLVEHENELPSQEGMSVFHKMQTALGTPNEGGPNRLARRARVAVYENHYRNVIDKVAAYLLRSPPKRDERAAADFLRVRMDHYVGLMVLDGLRFGEGWLGWDAADLPTEIDGRPITLAEVALLDPVHKGRPYLVSVDPRRVVDFDLAPNGTDVTRVVVSEVLKSKGSLFSEPASSFRYREWTATGWTLYERVNDSPPPEETKRLSISASARAAGVAAGSSVKVRVIDERSHSFGCCPFVRFCPDYPSVDIAELCRLLFNVMSLLDEELFSATFTQGWVTGVSLSDAKKMEKGTGGLMVFESPEAKVGTLGADAGNASALLERCADIRAAIYRIASMEADAAGAKNVAESAEKKRRDLQSLYTTLLRMASCVEVLDNALAVGLGILPPPVPLPGVVVSASVSGREPSAYDKKFDVASVEELQAELARLKDEPFVPASFRRSLTLALLKKLDPFGDHTVYAADVAAMPGLSADIVSSVVELKNAGAITDALAARALGIPEKDVPAFVKNYNDSDVHTEAEGGAALPPGAEDDGEEEPAAPVKPATARKPRR